MLSNKATPRYYAEFKEQVLRGEIPICQEIAMEMARIDDLIANPNFYYDDEAVEGWIAYCESELTLTDGSDLHLLPSFKLWAEQLYGWFYYTDRSVYVPNGSGRGGGHYELRRRLHRLTKKQYLIIARGGAKSMYDSCVQSYGLNVDTSTTSQVVTAPTMRQAEETLSPIRTSIIRSRGPLFKFLTEGSINNTTGSKAARVKLASTKKGIENFLTGSLLEIRPMSIDKLQGLRNKYSTVDEWLSGDIREDPIGALEQGASKLDDYIIVASSSEGTVRNGSGDTIKMELMRILRGEYYAPHVSIWYYKLDDISEIADPAMWIKANPNLGITVSYEAYQQDVERAEQNPEARNDIIAKRFGIPMEGYTYFFTYEQIQLHPHKDFWGLPCSLGMDASLGDDFWAFTFLFPLANGKFGVKALSFITEDRLYKLPLAARTKYEEFINEGTLIIMNKSVLEPEDIYDLVERHIELNEYDVRSFGYDPYNAKYFVERWKMEHSEYGVEKVIQGAKTESVPLGELRNLADKKWLLFDQSIMNYCMGNCITIEDTNGNRKLLKERRDAKIDNVSAMMDAFVAYKVNAEAFE